jgi:hypothetical protein
MVALPWGGLREAGNDVNSEQNSIGIGVATSVWQVSAS